MDLYEDLYCKGRNDQGIAQDQYIYSETAGAEFNPVTYKDVLTNSEKISLQTSLKKALPFHPGHVYKRREPANIEIGSEKY